MLKLYNSANLLPPPMQSGPGERMPCPGGFLKQVEHIPARIEGAVPGVQVEIGGGVAPDDLFWTA